MIKVGKGNVYMLSHMDIEGTVSGYISRPDTPVSVDVETTGFDPYTRKLATVQLKQFGKPTMVIDCRKMNDRQLKWIGGKLKPLFETHTMVGMNIKFDWSWVLVKLGVKIQYVYDVMLAEQVIRGLGMSEAQGMGVAFNLKAIAQKYGMEVSKEERQIFPDMDSKPEWNLPLSDEVLSYIAQDVEVLEEIYFDQQKLIQERGLELVVAIENKCLPGIASMEVNGIYVAQKEWRKFMQEKALQAAALEGQLLAVFGDIIASSRRDKFRICRNARTIWEELAEDHLTYLKDAYKLELDDQGGWGVYKRERVKLWKETNPAPQIPKLDESPMKLSSPAQVVQALQALGVTYEKSEWNPQLRKVEINIVPIDSTDSKVLGQLPEGKWPEVDMFLVWRKTNKFLTSFGESLLEKINPVTGRLHSNYTIVGTGTGRLSCRNPNLQQTPSKGDGKKLRSMIRAGKGNVLLTADFSNIELRILADMSQDENMLRFFEEGQDLHCETARTMFNLSERLTIEDIKELRAPQGFMYRAAAKTINFGLVYGMSATGLAAALKVSKDEAEKLMKAYFATYPGIAKWLEEQGALGVRTLKSTTLSGRIRLYRLPSTDHPDYRRERGSVERKAKNSPIQGTSADITKVAVALFYERAPEYAMLVATVHDEIVVESPKKHAEYVAKILRDAMDDACKYFLKTVKLPPTVVNISEAWEKI